MIKKTCFFLFLILTPVSVYSQQLVESVAIIVGKEIILKSELEWILQKTIREGVEQKLFNTADIKIVSFTIMAACNWTYHWYRPNGDLTPEQIADRVISLLEKGYMK